MKGSPTKSAQPYSRSTVVPSHTLRADNTVEMKIPAAALPPLPRGIRKPNHDLGPPKDGSDSKVSSREGTRQSTAKKMILITGTKKSSTSQGESRTERRRFKVSSTPAVMKGSARASMMTKKRASLVEGTACQRYSPALV